MNTAIPREFHRLGRSTQDLRPQYEARVYAFLQVLWRRKLLVLLLAAATLATGAATYSVLPRTYEVEVLVQLVNLGNGNVGASAAAPSPGLGIDAAAVVASEAQIIRSRAMARRVVERLQLAASPIGASPPSPPDWLSATFGRALAAFGHLWSPDDEKEDGAASTDSERLVSDVLSGLDVRNDNRSYLIQIIYTSSDGARSARIANAFAEEYLQSRIEASFSGATQTEDWLARQIEAARQSLVQADDAVRDFRRQSGANDQAGEGSRISEQQLRDLTAQLSAAKIERLRQEARLSRVRDTIASGHTPSVVDLEGSPAAQQLIEAELAAKREVDRIERTLGAKHPLYSRAETTLRDVQARLSESLQGAVGLIETSAQSARDSESALAEQVATLQRSALGFEEVEARINRLQASSDAARTRLQTLEDSRRQTLALIDLRQVGAQIVSPAEPTTVPSSPKLGVVLALTALVGGAGIAIVLFLLEHRDTGFRTASEVSRDLDSICLGMIPTRPTSARSGRRVVYRQAVRSLAIAAGLMEPKGQCALVVVTSSTPGEGKTELVTALAKLVANAGQRVLVVAHGTKRKAALASADRGIGSLVLYEHDITAGRVMALSAGEPLCFYRGSQHSLGEMFETQARLQSWLERVRPYFDLILVEGPAATLFAEAAVLARAANLVLYAVRWNRTPRRTVHPAFRQIEACSGQAVGVVITEVDTARHRKFRHFDPLHYYRRYRKHIAA